ncbi:spore coat protein [Paenibacillus sp. sptzw28]|uniref:spore coat protein n=1 Tax=Paenibacillus sp. sptzw28 TaxID=715179 RepID=UPI001C6EB121|nr:spore coat protein [Paenibacillus sp. sptzw28]QYR19364.1 spore coat protein [Paenibacillus sp. sptzw28]
MYNDERQPQHLAWHETLETHELVAFQANHLMGFKMDISNVKDPALKALYAETIQALELNLKDLLPYFKFAPVAARAVSSQDLTAYYAGHLLAFAKTSVRTYAIAITETATPALRETLQKHINNAIQLHAKVFYFMLGRGLYPSYDLEKLIANDIKNAQVALKM